MPSEAVRPSVELRGELGVAAAAIICAVLSAAMAASPVIEVDLLPRHQITGRPGLPFWTMTWVVLARDHRRPAMVYTRLRRRMRRDDETLLVERAA